MGLNERDDAGTEALLQFAVAKRLAERVHCRLDQKPQEFPVSHEIVPQPFGHGEGPESVRNAEEQFLPYIPNPEQDLFLVTRWAEEPRLAREGNRLGDALQALLFLFISSCFCYIF